jgi:hypothetical protein
MHMTLMFNTNRWMTSMFIPYEPMKNRFCKIIIAKSWPMKFVMCIHIYKRFDSFHRDLTWFLAPLTMIMFFHKYCVPTNEMDMLINLCKCGDPRFCQPKIFLHQLFQLIWKSECRNVWLVIKFWRLKIGKLGGFLVKLKGWNKKNCIHLLAYDIHGPNNW